MWSLSQRSVWIDMSVTISLKDILLLLKLSFSLLTLQSQRIIFFLRQGGGPHANFE